MKPLEMTGIVDAAVSPPARGRGLKPSTTLACHGNSGSPPARGRGLKHLKYGNGVYGIPSPPARGRGLKPIKASFGCSIKSVAPRAGAWIETIIMLP